MASMSDLSMVAGSPCGVVDMQDWITRIKSVPVGRGAGAEKTPHRATDRLKGRRYLPPGSAGLSTGCQLFACAVRALI